MTVARVVYLCLARLPHIVTLNTQAGTRSTDVVEEGIKYEFMGWARTKGSSGTIHRIQLLSGRASGENTVHGRRTRQMRPRCHRRRDLVGYSRQIHEDEIKMMIRDDMRVNIPPPLPRFASATDAGVG